MPENDNSKFLRAIPHREVEIVEFRVACGTFVGLSDIDHDEWERPGNALLPAGISWAPGTFAARMRGRSMEPRISDGMWGFFHPPSVGSRQHRLVLVEDRRESGIYRYTLKKYESKKAYSRDGTWRHSDIKLLALNGEHQPIDLDNDGEYWIVGWFVEAVTDICRVNKIDYPEIVDEQAVCD